MGVIGLLATAGCAATTEQRSDGQTHWMRACDADADCGELSCLCGVCTEACDADEACSPEDASCVAGGDVLAGGECSAANPTRICAPSSSTQPRAEIRCTPEGQLEGTGDFEVVISGDVSMGPLAVADDGTAFVAMQHGDEPGAIVRVSDGERSTIGEGISNVGVLTADGGELFAARWLPAGDEFVITKLDLSTLDASDVARVAASGGRGVAIDDEWVYLSGESQLGPSAVSNEVRRSSRTTRESYILGSVPVQVLPDALVLLGDDIFIAGTRAVPPRLTFPLYRLPKDGSRAPELVELPSDLQALRSIASDGESLFLAVIHDPGDLEPDSLQGIARLSPRTGDLVMLAHSPDRPLALALDDAHVYWTSSRLGSDFESEGRVPRLIRTGKEGGSAVLATIEAEHADSVTVNGDSVHMIVSCYSEGQAAITGRHVVRVPKR